MPLPVTRHRFFPWLAAICGLLAVLASMGVFPLALEFVFKPLTTLLLIAYAWPRGAGVDVGATASAGAATVAIAAAAKQRRWVRVGLLLSLAGDVFLLWPRQGFLPGLVAFLLAHLAYIAAFCVPLRLASKPAAFIVYALVAAAMLGWLWPGIPAPLRGPVIAYVLCLATMAAQAFGWWRHAASNRAPDAPLARSAAIGGALFMVSDSLLAINKFGTPLPLSALWILASYWLAQWFIASSLSAPTDAAPTSP